MEGYDYYRTPRAQHPNSPNRYAFSSLPQAGLMASCHGGQPRAMRTAPGRG